MHILMPLIFILTLIYSELVNAEEGELILKTDDSEIYLENREGAWFLTGTVSRPEDAHLARDMVLLRDDVGQIEDEIKVAGESSEPPKELEISISDSAKNLALNLNILLSTEISGVSIKAKVEDGRVVLDGIVETEAEKLLVEEKVKLTTGAEVINRLEVGTGKNLNDKSEEVLSFISTIGIIVFSFSALPSDIPIL